MAQRRHQLWPHIFCQRHVLTTADSCSCLLLLSVHAAHTLLNDSAHLLTITFPYSCCSFCLRIAQALLNARISPYLVIETDVRPRFSRPAFQVTSYTSFRKTFPSFPLYFFTVRRTPT